MKKIALLVCMSFGIAVSAQLQDTKKAEECFKKADYKCAETEYTLLIEKEKIDRLKANFYNFLGSSQRRLGKTDLAFKSYEGALRSDPNNVQSYINLSSIHSQKGSKQKALDYANKGLLIDSENNELYLTKAKIYEDLKKNDLAEKEFKALIERNPENLIAKTSYASFKKNTGKLEEALKDYNQLISEKPESLLYNNRADTYFLLKKYKEATLDIEKAIKLDPKFSLSYVTKAKILFETQKDKDACTALQKAIVLGYEKYLVQDLLKKCGK